MTRTQESALIALVLTLALSARVVGSEQERLPPEAQVGNYVGSDVMIPMRDGLKLHAEIWRPRGDTSKLPILMQRSPYGFGFRKMKQSMGAEYKELAQEGFIFVLEDIRGRFGSEGEFVMLRPKATTKDGVDESTDTYDSIEWLIKTLPNNNGKVGVFGVSYLGWTTAMATVDAHPALKAVSVQASPEDMFIGDDFHHNGAFRLQYAWEYAVALETDGRTLNAFDFSKEDPYSWYLKQDDLATLDQRSLGRPLPSWQNFVEHPNYDAFWRVAVTSKLMPTPVKTPNLIVAGWWDQEDFYGPVTIYKRQQPNDLQHRNYLDLSFDAPTTADTVADHYVSDPANPVPYRTRPIAATTSDDGAWRVWLADDQTPFAKRTDVLSWQTDVLQSDVTIRGNVGAELYASTTGTDADWVVKLIDVYPADETAAPAMRGRQLMIANDVYRGRFRSGFEHPAALAANKVLEYSIDLHSASHVFKKGHRIAVQLQSTWFPLIDRNPQTFVPSIFDAHAGDFKAQTHTVYHSLQYPSAILVDIADVGKNTN